jgi:hypothetical protein
MAYTGVSTRVEPRVRKALVPRHDLMPLDVELFLRAHIQTDVLGLSPL